ncbi:MAG TPA: DUF6703 family protein [Actinophytocola sp.]|uniref:DUF6703 family protein n=1 Tax=Actinophytocola sp. TaxID=1872138 RepID=UPI002DDC952C|nr:DUF6703 family protein [Actinophytocola sp.]HEV2782578.1 DUF6703 family protein [Actinophytocola sp.]
MRGRRSGRTPLLAGDGPLARVPPVAAFFAVVAVFAVAVLVRGVLGAALLGLLAVAVGVLLASTWPALSGPARAGRVIILAALVAIAVSLLLTA